MTPEQFCYWLQGFFEISNVDSPNSNITPERELVIRDHLKLVFAKETPDRGSGGGGGHPRPDPWSDVTLSPQTAITCSMPFWEGTSIDVKRFLDDRSLFTVVPDIYGTKLC